MAARSISLVALVAITLVGSGWKTAVGPATLTLVYTRAKRYEPLDWMRGGERFSGDAGILVWDGNPENLSENRGAVDGSPHEGKIGRRLVPDFAESADPAISFDGQSVLFAGKRSAADRWQIWEVAAAGGEARQVTRCDDDCIRPLYLPENRAVYARKSAGRFLIEAADRSGDGKPVRLTYGSANFLPTDVLRDGRILFEASFPLGGEVTRNIRVVSTSGGELTSVGREVTPELYTVYSDGSGVESYRCDHGRARYEGRQVGSGDIVFASRARLGSRTGLGRFTSARAQEVGIAAPAGEYAGEVAEAATGDWILPWRANATTGFQLAMWKPGNGALRTVLEEKGANLVEPTMVVERVVPNRHPSGLHDWDNANLLCLNTYTSKYTFAAGSIRSVRFYERDEAGAVKTLGTAAVDRDGSFFVQVPTEQALQIELLDATGRTLKKESGFFWMRRGEQRACVGCHAGPETAPENAVPMVLLKSTNPADMTGGRRNAGH